MYTFRLILRLIFSLKTDFLNFQRPLVNPGCARVVEIELIKFRFVSSWVPIIFVKFSIGLEKHPPRPFINPSASGAQDLRLRQSVAKTQHLDKILCRLIIANYFISDSVSATRVYFFKHGALKSGRQNHPLIFCLIEIPK